MTNILILGATGGIGSAIAYSLADKNISIIIHGTHEENLLLLKNNLINLYKQVTILRCDMSQQPQINEMISHILKEEQQIDWIINTAGYIDENEPVTQSSHDRLVRYFNINVIAPIFITQSLLNKITPTGGVIMISSTASLSGNPDFPIYSATKAALNTFTQALAKQFVDTKKTAIVICPAGTNTEMRARIANDAQRQQSPESVAKHIFDIVFKKSKFSNGDIVVIKNGDANKIQ